MFFSLKTFTSIVEKFLIVGHDLIFSADRLCDQHPIKRISVMKRHLLQRQRILRAKSQKLKSALFGNGYRIKIDGKFSNRGLDHQFGDGDGAEINGIAEALNCLFLFGGEFFQRCDRPQKYVRVDNDLHTSSP